MKRRALIKWSLLTTTAASVGVVGWQYWQQEDWQRLDRDEYVYSFLQADDRLVLMALAPACLGQERLQQWLDKGHTLAQLLRNFDESVSYLSPHTQRELRELFNLLANRLGKLLLAGVWSTWSQASIESLNEFLLSWRDSWLSLLNSGYIGLQQLMVAAFYSDKDSWESCGYKGPPL